MCPAVYTPVCGDDGVTYTSGCRFAAAACRNPDLGRYKEGACGAAVLDFGTVSAVFMVAAVVACVVGRRFRRAAGNEIGDDVRMSGDGRGIFSEGDSPGSFQKDGKTPSSDRSISEEKLTKHSNTETTSMPKDDIEISMSEGDIELSMPEGDIETILTPKGAGHPLDAATPSVPSPPFSLSTSELKDIETPELDQDVSSPPCALLPRVFSPAKEKSPRESSPVEPAGGFQRAFSPAPTPYRTPGRRRGGGWLASAEWKEAT